MDRNIADKLFSQAPIPFLFPAGAYRHCSQARHMILHWLRIGFTCDLEVLQGLHTSRECFLMVPFQVGVAAESQSHQ